MNARDLVGLAAACLALAGAAAEPAAIRLTVREAVERARESAPALEALAEHRLAAEDDLGAARAERRPRLDARASYARWSDVPEFSTVDPATGETTVIFPNLPNNSLARVDLRAPLYVGGRTAALERAAEERLVVARGEHETAARDLELETVRAYWTLALLREHARVLSESLAAFEAHLADARNFERVGIAPRSEVLRVEVERDRAELARIRAESAARIAQADLARLVALPPGTAIEIADPIDATAPVAGDLEPLVLEALESRPERAVLSAHVRSLEAAADAERAVRRPHANLAAGWELADPQRRIVPPESGWNDAWDVGVAVTLRLWDGGRARAAASRADHEAAAARWRLEDLDRRIRLEVVARWEELVSAASAIAVAERGVASAREAERVATERYRAGVLPSSELLDVEAAGLIAGLDRVESWARMRIARATLDRAVGR